MILKATLGQSFFILFAGCVFFLDFFLSIIREIELFEGPMLPGVYFVLFFICLITKSHLSDCLRHTSLFICGIAVDSIPFWIMRPGTHSLRVITGPWDFYLFITSGFGFLFSFFVFSLIVFQL